MIVRTTIAVSTLDSTLACRRRRSGSSRSSRAGTARRAARRTAPSTKIPQRPTTTLGTAASISISVPIGAADRRRRELAQEEADRDRERRGEQHRAERRDERADDELARAELRPSPGSRSLCQTKPMPNCLDRRPGAVDDLPDDRGDDRRSASSAASAGQAVEHAVADPVAERAGSGAGAARRVDGGFHGRQLSSARQARGPCHHSVTRRSHPVHPASRRRVRLVV